MKIKVAGVELHCDVAGSGPAVLFVHGFPLSGRLWEPAVRRLSSAYRCIVPDLRGMGRSRGTATATMQDYAEDLAVVLDAVGETGPVVAVGLSMGGYVLFEFFRRHRGRVRALVLADTQAVDDKPETRAKRQEMIAAVRQRGSSVAAEAMIEKLFGPDASAGLRREWLEIMSASPSVGVTAALQAMADRPDSRPTLAEIDVPTLIAVGEHDAITPPGVHREMHEAIRGASLEIVPGAGHMLPVEKPEAFGEILERFLAEHFP